MSKDYHVIWAETARNDLNAIIEYIAVDRPNSASRNLRKVKEKASELNSLPERGRIVPELSDQGIVQYRELIVPPWRLIYRISGKNVHILTLIDSRRSFEDILFRKLTGQFRGHDL